MRPTRREFLAGAAAVPIVFGLPLAGCKPVASPPWLSEALARIRTEGRLGLVVRLPNDPKQRCQLGHLLTGLVDSQIPEFREVLADVVVLCLENPVILARFGAARSTDPLLLVDGDGYILDGLARVPDGDDFPETMRRLIDGADGARGRARAESARRRATPRALARLQQLESTEDVQALAAELGPILPLVVAERLATERTDRQGRLLAATATYYDSLPRTERGPRLPYGIELAPGMRGGCGNCGCAEVPAPKALPPCGIGRMAPQARSFVKFLKA